MENNKKHLYWVIGLVLITIILSGTLIWINHNSWTLRFEMDDNTKEAIESIRWEELNKEQFEGALDDCIDDGSLSYKLCMGDKRE